MTTLLLRDDLRARGIRYSNMHLLRLEKAGTFPRRVRFGGRVGWVEDEIEEWLRERVAERDREVADAGARR